MLVGCTGTEGAAEGGGRSLFPGCPSLMVPGSELWNGSVEFRGAADQNKVGTGEAHPVSVQLGSALSGSCLTWKELFVCLPCAMGTRLDQGGSGAADPGGRHMFGSR